MGDLLRHLTGHVKQEIVYIPVTHVDNQAAESINQSPRCVYLLQLSVAGAAFGVVYPAQRLAFAGAEFARHAKP